MSGAGEALQAAALAALRALGAFKVYDGPPVQGAFPFAVVEIGSEVDWGHKSGRGRELRLAVVLRDKGESPARLQRLMGDAEDAVGALGGTVGAWQLVTLALVRRRTVPPGSAWAGLLEYRARMLAP